MYEDKLECPECTIARGGITQQKAWDLFWMSTRDRRITGTRHALVEQAVVRSFTVGRADPTAVAKLACGHIVPD
jgi:hypothetical protein